MSRESVEQFLDKCKEHIRGVQERKGVSRDSDVAFPRLVRFFDRLSGTDKEDELTVADAVREIVEEPRLEDTCSQRIWRNIKEEGIEPLPEDLHYFYREPEEIYRYSAFSGLKGIYDSIHDTVLTVRGAALGLELSRVILGLISHPGYGKSEWIEIVKGLLEGEPMFVLKDCPNNDSPLWILPTSMHDEFETKFGIKIDRFYSDSDICPSCRHRLINQYNYNYLEFPVERVTFSDRANIGIFTSDPKDVYKDSVSEFIGEIEIGKSPLDPDAIEPGAFGVANRGLVILEELLRREPEMLHPLISSTQKGESQAPGRLGEVSTEILPIFTSNEEVWEEFKNDPTNSPYKSRMLIVRWRRNLILSEEIEAIKRMLSRSDVYERIHQSPWSLEMIGRVFIASALEGIEDKEVELKEIQSRIDLYNGTPPDELGFDKPAYEVREDTGDGYRPALALRELKDLTDILLAQLAVNQEATGHDRDLHFCLPPCMIFNQLLEYLHDTERFDRQVMERLETFIMFLYYNKIVPNMKADIISDEAVEAEAEKMFAAFQSSSEMDEAVAEILEMSRQELREMKGALDSYTDHPKLKEYFEKQAVHEVRINERTVDKRAALDSDRWCDICLTDVIENNNL